jgi:hypothetical protein
VNTRILLQKLIEIERSIGVETECATRRRVIDFEAYIMHMDLAKPKSSQLAWAERPDIQNLRRRAETAIAESCEMGNGRVAS